MATPRWLLTISIAFATACGAKAVPPATPGAGTIELSEGAAPAGLVELGHVSAQSGKGCGVLGTAGSREQADSMLRNEAAKLGASYVQLTDVQQPGPNHQCIEHEYKLSGTAYGKPTPAPAPAASAAAPPTSSATAVPAPAASSAPLPPTPAESSTAPVHEVGAPP